MPRTITIGCLPDGQPMYSLLQRALRLLDGAGIRVEAAAQNVHADSPATATILLRYQDDRPKAIEMLDKAGIPV